MFVPPTTLQGVYAGHVVQLSLQEARSLHVVHACGTPREHASRPLPIHEICYLCKQPISTSGDCQCES